MQKRMQKYHVYKINRIFTKKDNPKFDWCDNGHFKI